MSTQLAAVTGVMLFIAASPALADSSLASAPASSGSPDSPAAASDPSAVDVSESGSSSGAVTSAAPAQTTTPDHWTMTVSAKDETQAAIAPLTTAATSREYLVGGVFTGAAVGPDGASTSKGTLEVGYQIGCGIDMGTGLGVTLGVSAGITSSLGLSAIDGVHAPGLIPAALMPVGGGVTVGLKPGIINTIPVVKKEYAGADPWVSVSSFHIAIDGCVGQSFLRSYATLSRSTDVSESTLTYVGITKTV